MEGRSFKAQDCPCENVISNSLPKEVSYHADHRRMASAGSGLCLCTGLEHRVSLGELITESIAALL